SISHPGFAAAGFAFTLGALGLGLGGGGLLALAQDLALVDEDLHADGAVRGLGFREAVFDVGAQRMQRHAAFAIPLGARDLGAVEPPRARGLDALGADAHGVLHRALHGAAG